MTKKASEPGKEQSKQAGIVAQATTQKEHDESEVDKSTAEVPAEKAELAVIAKDLKFSAEDREVRVICIPHQENLADYKKTKARMTKEKSLVQEMVREGIVRQPEMTPYGNKGLNVTTVTATHPKVNDDLEWASSKATFFQSSVKEHDWILVVESPEAMEAALTELAAAAQVREQSGQGTRLRIGADTEPTKFGFIEFRDKGVIGFANSKESIDEALEALEKSEYGKLQCFTKNDSSTGIAWRRWSAGLGGGWRSAVVSSCRMLGGKIAGRADGPHAAACGLWRRS